MLQTSTSEPVIMDGLIVLEGKVERNRVVAAGSMSMQWRCLISSGNDNSSDARAHAGLSRAFLKGGNVYHVYPTRRCGKGT